MLSLEFHTKNLNFLILLYVPVVDSFSSVQCNTYSSSCCINQRDFDYCKGEQGSEQNWVSEVFMEAAHSAGVKDIRCNNSIAFVTVFLAEKNSNSVNTSVSSSCTPGILGVGGISDTGFWASHWRLKLSRNLFSPSPIKWINFFSNRRLEKLGAIWQPRGPDCNFGKNM